jgi:hypothetical protein
MKSLIVSVLAVLLGIAFYVAPTPVKAAGPADCTNGCEIVTCSGNWRTVWHCDSGGCLIVGGYGKRKGPPAPGIAIPAKPAAFDAVCGTNSRNACAIKTCANGSCSISLYDRKSKSFVRIGEMNDVEKMIYKANSTLNR